MRVTLVTTSFPIHSKSASGPFVFELAQHLSKYTHIHVITPDDNSNFARSKYDFEVTCFRYAPKYHQVLAHQPGGIPVQLKKNNKYYLLLPFFIIGLLLSCIRLSIRTDIYHCNWAITGCIVGIVGHILRKPCVTTIRGSDVHLLEGSFLHKLIMRLCFLFNRKIIVVSESLARTLSKTLNLNTDKILVIPNGVAVNFTEILKSPAINHPARLLWIGNLTKNKNLEFVISACEKLAREIPFRLTVVGDGPERDNLIELSRQCELESSIDFVGSCSHEQICNFYLASDILIMSSIKEGRSNVLVEGLASGMVIIAPKIESVEELLVEENSMLLYNSDDLCDFLEKIQQVIIDEKLRRDLMKHSKSNFQKLNLDWNSTSQKYIGVYNSCL